VSNIELSKSDKSLKRPLKQALKVHNLEIERDEMTTPSLPPSSLGQNNLRYFNRQEEAHKQESDESFEIGD